METDDRWRDWVDLPACIGELDGKIGVCACVFVGLTYVGGEGGRRDTRAG